MSASSWSNTLKGARVWVASFLLLALGVAWWVQPTDVSIPKPLGHIRIALPDTASTRYITPCRTSFRIPNYTKIELREVPDGEEGCWYNLSFPRLQARVHCTEVPVGNQLPNLIDDAQSLVFGHEMAAAGIRRQELNLPQKAGMMYVLEGPVAAPIQFFVTDSTDHFLRGSLYFNHAPNPDSTAPVLERMEADIRRIMETLTWS